MKKLILLSAFIVCNLLMGSIAYTQQPNVLLIISDDQGIGDFGFMGNKHVKTPNLDQLAEQSALFENFVVGPACSPTRSGLMTGRNHLKAGVWGVGARNNLMRDEILMPAFFKSAGYGTGYFGKRDGIYLLEMEAWFRGCDEASHVTGYVHKDATSITHKGPIKREGWTCDVDVDNSLDYIKRQGNKPWWCSTAFILPHLPWEPDERFAKPYRDAGHSDLLSDFYGCIAQLDDAVGRLLRGLEELGQADNTVVVFLSDNGPSYKNMSETDINSRNPLGLQGTKSTVWENGIKVPLMFRWPGHITAGERPQFVTVEDVLPTLIDLTGMDAAQTPEHLPFDGISIRQALDDPEVEDVERSVFRVAISFEGAVGGKRAIVNDPNEVTIAEQHVVLRGARYKLHNFADGSTALYDILEDPGETTDIGDQYPEILSQYKAGLQQQYDDLLSTGRIYRMPIVMVGENLRGYNSINGLMAQRATPGMKARNFHYLQGFNTAGDEAEYLVNVQTPGKFGIQVKGDNLDHGKGWKLEGGGISSRPLVSQAGTLVFDTIELPYRRPESITLSVDQDGEAGEAPLVKTITLSPVEFSAESDTFTCKEWPGTDPLESKNMGIMDGFYRHTQMQGHLVQNGLFLFPVPDFWCTGSDFPYLKKESEKEVFFVDEFSVTRFLGGYNQDWNHGGLQLKTNDMAYLDKNGRVGYRLNLVKGRLQPYIENGYTEFIIGFDNIWDLSRDPEQSGPYGPTAPPRDWTEWYNFIKKVCGTMTCVYPEEVQQHLKFKIGNEYNQKKSFTGTHEDYLKMYDYSAAAIRSIFPEAEIMPGEIGGGASGPDNAVDYPDLFEHFVSGSSYAGGPDPSPVSVLTRSSHSFPYTRDLSPRERVESSVNSFEEVLEGKPADFRESLSLEYHQFGVIGSPLLASGALNGSRDASWQFQVLFRSKAAGSLDKCWSWGKSEQIAPSKTQETHLLNGIGWLYSVLDHLRGDQAQLLVTLQPEGSACDVSSVAFVNENRVTLLLSSWSESYGATDSIPVRVEIPASLLPFDLDAEQAESISSTGVEDAYFEIRSDLAAADNLQAVFLENPGILGTIRAMAKSFYHARIMVYENMPRYEPMQQESLSLKPVRESNRNLQVNTMDLKTEISTVLSHDEVCVLVFDR